MAKYLQTKKPYILIVLISAFALWLADAFDIFSKRLAIKQPIQSELYIVEGWVDHVYHDTIFSILDKKKDAIILFAGTLSRDKYIAIFENGAIVIKNLPRSPANFHSLSLRLRGTFAFGEYARCKVFLNDSLLYHSEIEDVQNIKLQCTFSATDSISLVFPNNAGNKFEDRNLIVQKLYVDDSIEVPLRSEKIWIKTKRFQISTHYNSNAEYALNHFVSFGLPKERAFFTAAPTHGISKTYNTAFYATQWMKAHGYASANIISFSVHAKRTLISYKKAFPQARFGITSVYGKTTKKRVIKETVGSFLLRLTPKFILERSLKEKP